MTSPPIPMQRLQAVDKRLGWVVCALAQPLRWWRRSRSSHAEPARILCIKFWGIGSLQMLTAAARHLRSAHPKARVTLLTLAGNAEFARGLGVFDDVVTLDVTSRSGPIGWSVLLARIARLVVALRRARHDAVYDFEFFTRFSALVTLASGARDTHGFAAPNVWRGGFHARTVPFNRYWHAARNFRALAGGEDGGEVLPSELAPFQVAEEHDRAVETELARAGLAVDRPFVVLNPNAGQLSLERRWPAQHFVELARALVDEDALPVVFVGAPGEAEYVGSIARAIGSVPRGLFADLSGRLAVGELAALLARAACVVTNDSGPMHVAAALGAPTIGLFGPETPVMYGPLGDDCVGLWKPPACSPCINVHDNKRSTCIHGQPECLVGIAPAEVLDETRRVIARGVLRPSRSFPRRRLRVVAQDGAGERVASS
ncbi:MAG: glycosyltransferase family 9 protein [Planctomycetes bacterium]|nr:glycosyltransferase family 9 protein [Planctomycetota bacterium]